MSEIVFMVFFSDPRDPPCDLRLLLDSKDRPVGAAPHQGGAASFDYDRVPDEMLTFAAMADGHQVGWIRAWDRWSALEEFNKRAEKFGYMMADDVEEFDS